MLPFTIEELSLAVSDGRVTKRDHPSLPLSIYNYSPEVQYSNKWDAVTLNCRGLILDDQFNIVARPWQKFFNLGQVNLPMQFTDPVEVMDKADGSLGILYPYQVAVNGETYHAIATRGSFASTQAIAASTIWSRNYAEYYNDTAEAESLKGLTVLFEIILPENRIVLDYGDKRDLILLGAVDNERGYYYGPNQTAAMISWPGEVVKVFEYNTISDALGDMERKNAEGYVIRSHNFMVKLKQPDYLELHRLVTNASPKTVWEQLKAGKSKSEIVSVFPDEFHDYVGGMVDPLVESFETRLEEINKGFSNVLDSFMSMGDDFNRGGFARYIKNAPDKAYYFMLLDGKSVRDVLWSELKPKEAQ